MTLRRDAFPASPVNARLSWALRLALLLQCSPVSSIDYSLFLGTYLLLQLFFLVKKDSQTLTPKIMTSEAEKLLECVKLEVMNEEKNKNLTDLLYQHIVNLTKNDSRFSHYVNAVTIIQKKINLNYPLNINLENASIYQYLTEVYAKTQFISSIIINLTGVLLAIYLLTWAAHSFLIIISAIGLASLIASPIAVGIVILVATSFFLIRQLLEFRAREDHYQQSILILLNEKCEYTFKDVLGKTYAIEIEKWKKFEYLQKQIELLEQEIKLYIDNKLIDSTMKQFYFSFGRYFIKESIYKDNDGDKLSGDATSFFKKVKKCLNRLFALLGGGLYGYNLTQQIVWKSRLGIGVFSKVVAIPLLVFFCH
jgi:hypothetical protein